MTLVNESKKWGYAMGMLDVDGLKNSEEFLELVEQEKRGEITTEDMIKILKRKYHIE